MKLDTVKALFFWFAISLIGALIVFQVYRRDNFALSKIPVEPKAAPNFTLQGISLDQYKGQTVLLHFWATWCGPCREEMPHLISMSERLKGQIVILAVAVDSSEANVKSFFGDFKPNFPVLLDLKHEVASLYGISQFPETMLIGPDGKVQALYIGPQNWDLFEK
ncbi:MAG: TlpA disulfide reductase family protein [Myxococcaceae bacterium]